MTIKQAERLIKIGKYKLSSNSRYIDGPPMYTVVRVSDGKCLSGTTSYLSRKCAIDYFVAHYNHYGDDERHWLYG